MEGVGKTAKVGRARAPPLSEKTLANAAQFSKAEVTNVGQERRRIGRSLRKGRKVPLLRRTRKLEVGQGGGGGNHSLIPGDGGLDKGEVKKRGKKKIVG